MNQTSNGIALRLPTDDRHRLEVICAPVELARGHQLQPHHGPADEAPIYFLESATVSLWIEAKQDQASMAVALIGREGMVACSHLWPCNHSPWIANVLTPGLARVTTARQLRELISDSPNLVMAISEFLWQQTQEIAQLSARMLLGDIRTRLALWLHLMQHKAGRNTLPVTHDLLAKMLGTRRVSVTLVAGELQAEGILTQHRGEIEINDLQALARVAGLTA